jgi:4-amino-4-deoxy-L-arabinose transferase-like glycosyltransferase
MQRLARDYAVLITAAALVFFTNLGGARLWDRDEPRNAGCAREMLEAGDWVTPVFNAELRVHKPVLLYWFIMSAYAVFGVNEFAARFWSAVLAVGTVLMTYHLGRRLFNARVGVWAGVVLGTTMMFDVAARAATPDSVLIFFSTAPMLVYVLATFAPQDRHNARMAPRLKTEGCFFPTSWPAAALMYALMGAAVLAKGPVGLVLPTAVIGMYLLIATLPRRDDLPRWRKALRPFGPGHFLRTCWTMRPITALAVSMAVALPWYVWVHLRTDGQWTHGFFVTHNLGRATTAMEGHDGSLLFYPAAMLLGFFPWSVFAAPGLIDSTRRLRRGDPWREGYCFAACWVGVYVGLFSLASTKLPSYITPMYPGLALLGGCFVYHWSRGEVYVARLWPRLSLLALAVVGAAILVAVPLAARRYAPGGEWLGALGLLPLAMAGASFYWMERGRSGAAAHAFAFGAVVLMATMFGFATLGADQHQHSDVLLKAIRERSRDPHIASMGCLEPSWVFYSGRPIHPVGVEEFHEENNGYFAPGRESFVITTGTQLSQLESQLPAGVGVLAEAPYFLKDERLILLGRISSPAKTAARENSDSRR